MDLHNADAYTRRAFIARGMTLASAAVTVPYFIQKSAVAMARPMQVSSQAGVPEDRVVVVVQLGGGNDGLNTLIPFTNDAYYRARPGIAIPRDQVLRLHRNADVGLHPNLEGIKSLYDDGLAAIVQGAGYPNPNRSHFASMDIWHTGDTSGVGEGWLGKYFDAQCNGSPEEDEKALSGHAGVFVGSEAPLAMTGRAYRPFTFESPDLLRWTGNDLHDALRAPYDDIVHTETDHEIEAHSPEKAFLMRTAMDAKATSAQIRSALNTEPLVRYPASGLARQLAMVGSMIRAGLDTRVYYVTLGGFDTHRGQGGASGSHANLMNQVGSSLRAFYDDLQAQGNDGRVLTMMFSEFGRRVGQNASNGTDHGTAAPTFLFGPMVDAGLHSRYPSLTDLDRGDLKHTVDFRSVYTDVLEHWLGADAKKVLDKSYRPVGTIDKKHRAKG